MCCRIRIAPAAARAIREAGLSREKILWVFSQILYQLPGDAHRYAGRRHPDDAACFQYRRATSEGDRNYLFTMAVNDQVEPGRLLVQSLVVTSSRRPAD